MIVTPGHASAPNRHTLVRRQGHTDERSRCVLVCAEAARPSERGDRTDLASSTACRRGPCARLS